MAGCTVECDRCRTSPGHSPSVLPPRAKTSGRAALLPAPSGSWWGSTALTRERRSRIRGSARHGCSVTKTLLGQISPATATSTRTPRIPIEQLSLTSGRSRRALARASTATAWCIWLSVLVRRRATSSSRATARIRPRTSSAYLLRTARCWVCLPATTQSMWCRPRVLCTCSSGAWRPRPLAGPTALLR